ncbi:MAG: AtpZ/AtpI family protein [Candidatus Pristimantibacillus lignocellulolyticus]|uniref:AtpZ/AtpI family protein n=1 Tax=Candidatus Pristimantibacillus lignocellulolyticus TaxID=2994561 RepID=A0A9J6ZIM0_9BACL|nr:MAG: AtpZ/AtpI family protein [Candidatus Pristimantibacillus lignocellulolyticus]
MTKRKLDQPLYAVGLMGAIGINIGAFIVIGYWIGSYLSELTKSNGWVVGGVLTGLAIGIGSAILIVMKMLEGQDG